jgi:sugar lactone lactonase YvrE
MATTATTQVLADGFAFLEGPRWHDDRLFVSDMHDGRVFAVDAHGTIETIAVVPNRPSGLGWLPDGRLLVVSMTDRRVLRLENGVLHEHADLSDVATFHANDMVVDRHGRAYVGNFGFDFQGGEKLRPAALALVHPDGRVERAACGLAFPNGAVITPDGRTLVVAESFGRCLTAFDIAVDGSLSNKRLWADTKPAVPDGICLDAEGAIWIASPITKEAVRVRAGGEVTHRIPTTQQAVACALGGADGQTLFLLTSGSIERDECRAQRNARIEMLRAPAPAAATV